MMLFAIIILLAFLLQASGILVIFNTSCNFLLIATTLVSLRLIPYRAGFLGFFCGLLLDLLGIRHFGINTLSLTIIGILVSAFSKRIYPKPYILFFLVFLGTIISSIISLLCFFLFEGFFLNFLFVLKEALYNSIFAFLIFLFIRKKL